MQYRVHPGQLVSMYTIKLSNCETKLDTLTIMSARCT